MAGLGPEGTDGRPAEPVAIELITLNPNQVDNLLSMYGRAVLSRERSRDRSNFPEMQPGSGLSPEQREEIAGSGGAVYALEEAFRIIGISGRAVQVNEEVRRRYFEERFPETTT